MGKPVRRSIVTDNSFEQEFDTALPTFVAPKKEKVGGEPQLVNLDAIYPNPEQPRSEFDEDSLRELADSILRHGVIQPIVLVPREEESGTYWLVAGERRCRASRLAGLLTIPAIVRESMERWLMAELALVENVQRENLNAMDAALAYQRLMEEYGYTQEDLATKTGKNQSSISRALQVLQAPTVAQEALQDGSIGMMTAVAMKGLTEAEAEPLVEAVKAGEMTQEQAKKEAKKKKASASSATEKVMHGACDGPTEEDMHRAYDFEHEESGALPVEFRHGSYGTNHIDMHGAYDEEKFPYTQAIPSRDEMLDVILNFDFMKANNQTLWKVYEAIWT